MKYSNVSLIVVLLAVASSCTHSSHDWLRTDRAEFEKLFPYFDTIIRNSEYYSKLQVAPELAIPDTLSVGTWRGNLYDAAWGAEEITMKISQTFPFIKGKFYSVRLSTDTGPDSVGGELRGLKKGERYIMVCQYRGTEEYLFFIEGRCFKVDQKDEIHSMIGNIIAEHEWFRSKGNFGLRKVMR